MSNLTVNGNITLASTDIESSNGYCAGALVGKANGGMFKNVVNNATITASSEVTGRVGGIAGAVFNEKASFENCVNNGEIKANVVTTSGIHAVAGIVGYLGVSDVTFLN